MINEKDLIDEIARLKQHINDLQSGMYINCVYCGHRYGPRDTTAATIPEAGANISMAEALKQHIEVCPKHPMSQLKTKTEKIIKAAKKLSKMVADYDKENE